MASVLLLLGAGWLGCAAEPDDTGPVATDSGSDVVASSAVADAGPDLSGEVGELLTLDGSASQGVGFLWDFGDGQQAEGDAVAQHAWTVPGTYSAVLQVTGEDGGKRSDSATVRIDAPRAEIPPTWSAPVAADGDRVYATAKEAGELLVCDAALADCSHQPICRDVGMLGVDGDVVAVTCPLEGQVVLWDAAAGAEAARVAVGTGTWPFGVVGRDGVFWVSLQGTGEVVRLTAAGEADRLPVGPDLRGIALGSDDRVYVSRWRSDPGGGQVFVVQGGADGSPLVLLDTLVLPLDQGVDSDTTTRGVPNLVEQLAITPDGLDLLVPALHSNILRGQWLDGQPLVQDQVLRAVVGVVDLADSTGADVDERRKQLDERGRTQAVVPSPAGDRLYALHPGAESITVLDRYTLNTIGAVLDVGAGAQGLAFSPDGDTLYVHAWLDRQLRAYDITTLPSPPTLLASTALAGWEPLSDDQLRGKQLFWTSADTRLTPSNYIACAHCHPDGQDDGQVWDFTDRGEGLRKTQSLLGVGTGADTSDPAIGIGTGRLHWSGNFDEIQDFENDIRNHFGGTGLMDDADWAECSQTLGEPKAGRSSDLDALATFVHSLVDPLVSPFPRNLDGEKAFLAAGCAECHPAPKYTDSNRATSVRHDIGTLTEASGYRKGGELDGFDTPGLVGTWARGPWLHDGSAPTVLDAIMAHDSAADLDADTAAAIEAFVLAL